MAAEEGHEARLEELFERILEEKRRGATPDLESIARRHPEFAEELKELLPAMELLVRGGGGRAAQAPVPAKTDERSIPELLASRFGSDIDPKIVLEEKRERSAAFVSGALARLAGKDGRYEFRSEIGRGGQGAVLAVWDGDLRRNLAMKVLLERGTKESSGPEPRTLGRFLEEAQITAQLDHPGIVPVHELGLDPDARVYFTMKLVQGRDLRAIFELVERGEEGWTLTRALNVLLKVCEAMAYAHAKGVIHRDLKPSNVMVGRYGEVYVMDWGLARVLGREDRKDIRIQPGLATSELHSDRREASLDLDSPLITMEGDVVGTPAYMSPEQARGDLEVMGPQSDVYSLGAMLYHLLAGQMPYVQPDSRLTNHAIWALVQRGPPDSLQGLAPSAPVELVAISEKAMARDPIGRYADMGALAEDLRAFLENRVVSAHRTGALVELRKWIERNRSLALAIAFGLLTLIVGFVTSLVLKARADRNATEAKSQSAITQAVTDFLTQDVLAAAAPKRWDPRNSFRGLGWNASMREVLDQASSSIDEDGSAGGRFADQPLVEAAIRASLGRTYLLLGEAPEAARHYERAYRLRLVELGEERRETMESMRALGSVYYEQGRYEEAEPLLERGYEAAKQGLGEHDHETLWILCMLGCVQEELGDIPESERLWKVAFEGCQKHLPPGDPLMVGVMLNLGRTAEKQGRVEEAEKRFLQALELCLGYLSEDDFQTQAARSSLGKLYLSLDRIEEAAEQLTLAIDTSRRMQGPADYDALDPMANLAVIRTQQGRVDEARALTVELLERWEKHASQPGAGPKQKNAYAWALLTAQPPDLRDPEKALAIALEVDALTSPKNVSFLATLALAHHLTGDADRAIEAQRRALEVLPPGDLLLRRELEGHLAEFEAVLTQGSASK